MESCSWPGSIDVIFSPVFVDILTAVVVFGFSAIYNNNLEWFARFGSCFVDFGGSFVLLQDVFGKYSHVVDKGICFSFPRCHLGW